MDNLQARQAQPAPSRTAVLNRLADENLTSLTPNPSPVERGARAAINDMQPAIPSYQKRKKEVKEFLEGDGYR